MLYSYNLYCDTWAARQKGSRGSSQLCGDDSIRAGNEIYIQSYKDRAIELGSKFSTWKDVTAANGRGVFTELYMEDTEVLRIPKVKTVARPEGRAGIPPWKTAIQAIQSIQEDLPFKGYLEEEILYPHRQFFDDFGSILPLFLPRRLGGLGTETAPRPAPQLKRLWDRLKMIDDKYVAFRYTHHFIEPLQIVAERGFIPAPRFEPFGGIGSRRIQDTTGWGSGASKWLYLEHRRLRGLIEAAITLAQRPPRPTFKKEPRWGSRRQLEIPTVIREQVERMRILEKLLPGSESTLTDEQFLNEVYFCDVSKDLVNAIAGI
jgi:hypothetical protein